MLSKLQVKGPAEILGWKFKPLWLVSAQPPGQDTVPRVAIADDLDYKRVLEQSNEDFSLTYGPHTLAFSRADKHVAIHVTSKTTEQKTTDASQLDKLGSDSNTIHTNLTEVHLILSPSDLKVEGAPELTHTWPRGMLSKLVINGPDRARGFTFKPLLLHPNTGPVVTIDDPDYKLVLRRSNRDFSLTYGPHTLTFTREDKHVSIHVSSLNEKKNQRENYAELDEQTILTERTDVHLILSPSALKVKGAPKLTREWQGKASTLCLN